MARTCGAARGLGVFGILVPLVGKGRIGVGFACVCLTCGQRGVLAAEATQGSGFAGGLVGPVKVLSGGGSSVFVNVGLPAGSEGDPPREFRHVGQD